MRSQPMLRRRAPRGSMGVLPAIIAGLAIVFLSAAVWLLWEQFSSSANHIGRIPAAACLLSLAIIQLRMGWRAYRNELGCAKSLERNTLFWRFLSCGPVVCYLAALTQGPGEGALLFFLATVSIWLTVGMTPLALTEARRNFWFRQLSRRPVRLAGWSAFLAVVLGVGIESIAQMWAIAAGSHLSGSYVAHCCALAPGMDLRGRQVNARGYWDAHDQEARGRLKVAAIGDSMLLAGSTETNHLAQVERRIPSVVIYNFGRPQVGPREYEAQLAREVAAERPDLVLAYISIGDDICEALPAPSLWDFDWHGLGVYQWGYRAWTRPGGLPTSDRSGEQANRDVFLRQAATRLAVCRSPISPDLESRWAESLEHLAGMIELAHRQGYELALVLVPAEFQVSNGLYESLRRQAGCEPGQLDLDLPQRRLCEFAARQNVPVLDLLPSMRASPESLYERNDVHWNDRGNAIAAEALAGWLQSRLGAQVATTAKTSR